MSENPLLEITGLSYRYHPGEESESGFVVRISGLAIEKGTITVLEGENGSGKTTLLKLIAGLLSPSSGNIAVSSETSSPRKSVYVHQTPYLLRGSVFRNVSYGLKIRKVPPETLRRRVDESLDAVGLVDFGKRPSGRLSGGEKQRVALARALAVDPELLLLDEPTASVDSASVLKLETIIEKIAAAGTAVLIASHNPSFSYRVAGELLRIEDGELVPVEMNVLKGRVSRTDDRFVYFETGGEEVRCAVGPGDYRAAVIPFDDVILSNSQVETSAQNVFEGSVKNIERQGSRYRVDVDCGFDISSLITGYSIDTLRIAVDAPLYVIFKATAVRLY